MRKLFTVIVFLLLSFSISACTGVESITISFETNGGNEIEDMIVETTDSSFELPTPIKEGYTFDGWFVDEELINPFAFAFLLSSTSLTVYAKWISGSTEYTITFDTNGGNTVAAIIAASGATVTAPTPPTKTGYTFGGWYSDIALTTTYTFTSMPASNITLYAKWTAVVIQTTITFETNGGSLVAPITQNTSTAVSAPTVPTKEGYTFGGWYSDIAVTTAYSFTTMPATNITLYAKWTANQYTISFEENGGSAVTDITQAYLSTVTVPTPPTREGYTFAGWYSDVALTTAYTFGTMPLNGITLYAKWAANQYTVSFEEDGGSLVTDITQAYLSTVTAPTAPTKEGYTFGGWYSDVLLTVTYTFTTIPANNITLYAKWTANQYTISFEENGGSLVTDITQAYLSVVTAPTTPTKEGYTFDGWYSDVGLATVYTFRTMPLNGILIYAKWQVAYIEDDTSDYTFFLKEDNTYEVTGYIGTNTELVIPSSYLDVSVTSIGNWAFYGNASIISVIIPSTVTSIGDYAFYECINMISVLIPSSVTHIGYVSFDTCTSLTSVFIPSSVTFIDLWAFANLTSATSIIVDVNNTHYSSENGVLFDKLMTTLITYPAGKTETHYTIPSTVTHIGQFAFNGCHHLESVIIPSTVTDIGVGAFYYTMGLNSITVDENNSNYSSDSGVLFDKLKTLLIRYPSGKTETSYVIPSGVISIEESAFTHGENLTSITIPNTVTTIGEGSFSVCYNLISITIPSSVVDIGNMAFTRNQNLSSILVDTANSNYSSENGVLFDKLKTTLITYPAGKTEAHYTIPSSVTDVTIGAFAWNYNLNSISIPSNVTNIESGAFARIYNLENITVDGANSHYSSENGVLFDKLKTTLILYPTGKTETQYTIRSSVTTIAKNAFSDCLSITELMIPSNVINIEQSAIARCLNLTIYVEEIELPSGWHLNWNVSSSPVIWGYDIIIESTITFDSNGGSVVTSITLEEGSTVIAPDDPTKEGYTFDDWYLDEELTDSYTFIVMPIDDVILYAKWDIIEDDPADYTFTLLPDDTYEVSGYTGTNTELVIPSSYLGVSVTSIGDWAFNGNTSITSVIIPSTITRIGDYAFYQCFDLVSVNIPSSVTYIGFASFNSCMSLTDVVIPSSVTDIGLYAFSNLASVSNISVDINNINYSSENGILFDKLKTTLITYPAGKTETQFTIPSYVTNIGNLAFNGGTSLLSITIPSTVIDIGVGVFNYNVVLTNITVDENNSNYSSENGVLFDKLKTTLIAYPAGKTETHYTIPSSVSTIDDYAFAHGYHLTSITIPDTVTSIGYSSFLWCYNLTSITIPNSVMSIGYNAFSACSGLLSMSVPFIGANRDATGIEAMFGYFFGTDYYEGGTATTQYYMSGGFFEIFYIPTNLQNVVITDALVIHDRTFYNCNNLVSITITSELTSIGFMAFRGCSSMTNFVIPDTVTSIDQYAFFGCTSLLSITIPSGVNRIELFTFAHCYNLLNITISEGVTYIDDLAVYLSLQLLSIDVDENNLVYSSEEGVLFSKDESVLIIYPAGKLASEYTIPLSVSSFGKYAFFQVYNLMSLTVSVDHLYLTSENGIIFNEDLTSIFAYPAGKTEESYVIPATVTVIGQTAFNGNQYLTSITIPSGVVTIGQEAFWNCIGLLDMIIPSSVTTIESWAFQNCLSLTNIIIPSSVEVMGYDVFSQCENLIVYVEAESQPLGWDPEWNASGRTIIWGYILGNESIISFDSNGGSFVDSITQDFGTTLIQPEDPTKEGYIFDGWYLDEELTVPYVFSTIPQEDITLYAKWNIIEDDPINYTFTLLPDDTYEVSEYVGTSTELVIPSSYLGKDVTSIGARAFFGNTNITSVIIPTTVTDIRIYAFYGCINMVSINIPFSVINIGFAAFNSCMSLTNIVISSSVTDIGLYAFANIAGLLNITVDVNNNIYSSENGVLFDKLKTTLITYPAGKTETQYTILSSVTSIGDGAFYNCTSLTSIEIPSSVTSIGSVAFRGCTSLTSITIPDSVTSIGDYAFRECTSLTSIEIPSSVTIISEGAFAGCTSLISIIIPSSVTSIDREAFAECTSLTSIEIPSSVTSIGDGAFAGCTSLISIIIPSSVTSIGDGAFAGCTSLTSIEIPSSVTSIGFSTFYNCTSLTSITIPNSVTSIGEAAFYGCTSLTSITIPDSVTSIGDYAFHECTSLTIYAEVDIQPIGWNILWNSSSRPVVWGYDIVSTLTITFDTNGGSVVESITQEEGSSVSQPENPTKEGYLFDGWYLNEELTIDYIFDIMPSENITLYAKWIDDLYQYISVENGGFDNFSLLGTDGSAMVFDDYQGEVNTWYFWTEDSSILGISGSVEINLGKLIITQESLGSVDFALQTMILTDIGLVQGSTYKIMFTLTSDTARVIDLVTKAPNDNYIEDTHNIIDVKVGTFEYEAIFTANQSVLHLNIMTGVINSSVDAGTLEFSNFAIYVIPLSEYSITYEENGGSSILDIVGAFGTTFENQETTRDGYIFDGWYLDEALTNWFADEVTTIRAYNILLYAKWQIEQYNMSYYVYDDYDPLTDIALNPGETILSVSLGYLHSSALTSTGRLFTWGHNNFGQLGDGTVTERNTPIEITNQFNLAEDETIICVSLTSVIHSSAVTSKGRLFTWGNNWYGQLGDGTFSPRFTPIDITNRFNLAEDEMIISVSLGGYYSTALTSLGRLFTWGHNDFGQLGDGTITDKNIPIEITSGFSLTEDETIISVFSGANHSLVLTSNGRVFPWGRNDFGQLGDNTTIQRNMPVEITSQFNLAEGETIISVSLRGLHSSAITSVGRLFTWGDNSYGQLGDNTTIQRNTPTEITSQFNLAEGETIIHVSLGDRHSSAVTSSGRSFTWGDNSYGQLGDSTLMQRNIPTDITSQFSLATGESIENVSLGTLHSSVFTSSGHLFTWGYNSNSQLGDGTIVDKLTPVELCFSSSTYIQTDNYDLGASITEYVPVQEGFTFNGWYSDIQLTQEYIFATMPASNVSLYGRWIPVE